jgi:radical SAM protein with 4Fe4S-binding SPASM domain
MINLKIDPEFQSQIPPLTDDEFKQLEENILKEGKLISPLIVWNNTLVDGHNRYEIVQEHPEISFSTMPLPFESREEVLAWICKNQLGRRNLTPEQKKFLIGKQYSVEHRKPGGNGNNQHTAAAKKTAPEELCQFGTIPPTSAEASIRKQIAERNNVSESYVARSEKFMHGVEILEQMVPGMQEKILSGQFKVRDADMHRLARADFPNRKQIVHEILHPEDRSAPQSSYSHYSEINYSALEAAVRRIQQDVDFLMRYLPNVPDDAYVKVETTKILKQHKAYRRFISGIYPTIDSMALNYMTRYDLDPSRNNTNETFKLLCCIKTLLHYGIHVDLGTNIDRHNHKEIWNTLDDLKKLQLLQDKNFAWTIGRVDDRLYETNFPDIMMESEILAELQSKPLPDNVHAAFLKTCYNFADKMGLKLNLREHKQTHSYCWSTSSSSNVFYVDMNLKTYRCTCTVGRSRYSLFDFSYENLTNYRPVAVTCNSYAECKDCKIGGFCGGGCQLSHQIDFKKCCTYEEEVFSHFMKTLFIPYIKSKYNEVNQNERKAENRCT